MKRHNASFTLIVALLLIAGANVVVASVLHAHLNLGGELGLEMVIVCVGLAIPIGLTLAALWPELRAISAFVSDSPAAATPTLLRFVNEELRLLREKFADIRSRGIDLERGVVTPWIRERCFAVSSGAYRTTDILVPSVFLETYSEYLRAHASYITRTGSDSSCRVNVAPLGALADDRAKNVVAWERYKRWHADHKVTLMHLDPSAAREIARQNSLGETIDIATWENDFALLVEYRATGETNLRMAFTGETWYRRCSSFIEQVLNEAILFSEIDFASRDIAQRHSHEDRRDR